MAEIAKEGKDSERRQMRENLIVRMHGANHFVVVSSAPSLVLQPLSYGRDRGVDSK